MITGIQFNKQRLERARANDQDLRKNLYYLVSQTDINVIPKEWRGFNTTKEKAIDDFWLFGVLILYKEPQTGDVFVLNPDNILVQRIPDKNFREIYKVSPINGKKENITRSTLYIARYENNYDTIGVPLFDPDTGYPKVDLEKIKSNKIFKNAVERAIENLERSKLFHSSDQLSELWEKCQNWIKKYKPLCAESIYQVDSISEGLFELGEVICSVVGYYKESENYSENDKISILEKFSEKIGKQKEIPPNMKIPDEHFWDLIDKEGDNI